MRAAIIGATIVAVAVVSGLPADAQDYPAGIQVLHGTIDNDSLTVQCDPPSGNRMHCSFAQTMVSRPADHKDFEGTIAKSIDDALSSDLGKSCKGMADFAQAIRMGTVPPGTDGAKFTRGLASMKPEHKADLLDQIELIDAFCSNPNRKTAEALLRANHEKELKTCKVRTNTYEQNFSTADGGKSWISNEGPKGECGVIYISKFERAKGEFSLWAYTTQKVVTKKDGDPILNLCTTLDERQIFYDWSGTEKYLNCVYVDFGY
jgi:hypothetical protein